MDCVDKAPKDATHFKELSSMPDDDSEDSDKEEQEKQIQDLIKSLGIRRYCCKMRLFTCKDIVEDIVPVNNNI